MISSDLYQYGISLSGQFALLIALILAALAIVIYLGRRKIHSVWLSLKTRYRLNRLGLRQMSGFKCPDGMGHFFTIDRLVMRHDGISVLLFIQYPGRIFCADDIDQWTQMLAGKSYRFNNPLVDLDYQVRAIAACIPDVPVNGFLLFDQHAVFPKGHPDRVIQLDNIPDALKRDKEHKVLASIESAWGKLSTLK